MVLSGCFWKPSPESKNGDAAAAVDAVPDVSGFNRIFISSTVFNFATPPARDALDTACQSLGSTVDLSGTFIAAVQYAGGPTVDERLAGASGFVQVDGSFVGNTWADMVAGNILHPIDQLETPTPVSTDPVFTGIGPNGVQGPDCATGRTQGSFGFIGTATQRWYANTLPCGPAHVYCVQTDHKGAMLPPLRPPSDAHYAWVTSDPSTGIHIDDSLCKRGIGETGHVFLYDGTGQFRTPPPIAHWYRDDGVFLGNDLATTTIPITTAVDGTHPIDTAWFGTPSGAADTCGSWQGVGTGADIDIGDPARAATGVACSEKHRLLCFEDVP